MKNFIKSLFVLCLLLAGTSLRAQNPVTATGPTTGGPCPDLNISTGIDNAGNPIAIGAPDPNWVITAGPTGPATPRRVMSWIPNWVATPIPGTNAGWINQTGAINGNPNGIYTFTRTFTVAPGTTSFTANFGVGYDDALLAVNLITPSSAVIPLAVPPTPPGQLSPPIGYTQGSPAPGVWKIEVIVRIVDERGAALVSGYIDFDCGDNPCNCQNIQPTFTYTTDEDCITTFVAQINSNCLGSAVQYDWYVNGILTGSGQTWSYAFPANGTYSVCLVVTLTTADGQTCVREFCRQVKIECDPCNCDLLKPNFNFTIDKCTIYLTGAADVPCCMTDVVYDWYVDGNPAGSGPNLSYTFTSNGFYNICVFVTTTLPDGTQCHKEFCKLVEIKDCTPCNCEQLQASITSVIDKCNGNFTVNAWGPDCMTDFSYQWTVNGNPAGSGPVMNWTFPTNGTYTVCVTVSAWVNINGVMYQCHKEFCTTVEIKDCDECNCNMLQPQFIMSMAADCGHVYFEDVTVTPKCMEIIDRQWFVNGVPVGSGPMLSYYFSANGTYQVCLYVTAVIPSTGEICQKQYCQFITIDCHQECDCEKLQIGFDVQTDKCDGHFEAWVVAPPECFSNITYDWYVNGSPVGSGPSFGYTFPANGTYLVCLYVTATLPNGQLCQKEVCKEVTITDCEPCNCEGVSVSYVYEQSGCTVWLYGNSSGIPSCATGYSYQWTVNGNPVGTGSNLVYTFPGSGSYYVCLTITVTLNNGQVCTQQYCRWVTVQCPPCNCEQVSVSYQYQVQNCTGNFNASVLMPACITSAPVFQWTVNGNPVGGGGPNLTYSFPASGAYYVCVTVTVNINGQICTKQYCRWIEVNCPCTCAMLGGNFNVSTNGCIVKLQALPQIPPCMQGAGFTWTVNGSYIGSSPSMTWIAPSNGIYTICLVITAALPNGQKCEKVICKNVKVVNCGPIVIGPGGAAMPEAPITMEESVLLYPNPASDEINVDFTTQEDGEVVITFKTTDGKVVLTQTKMTEAGDQHFELAIPASVVDEMIFVEITTASETIVRKVSVSKR
jgi:hypothetical protein